VRGAVLPAITSVGVGLRTVTHAFPVSEGLGDFIGRIDIPNLEVWPAIASQLILNEVVFRSCQRWSSGRCGMVCRFPEVVGRLFRDFITGGCPRVTDCPCCWWSLCVRGLPIVIVAVVKARATRRGMVTGHWLIGRSVALWVDHDEQGTAVPDARCCFKRPGLCGAGRRGSRGLAS
jgi:hypothetical protein